MNHLCFLYINVDDDGNNVTVILLQLIHVIKKYRIHTAFSGPINKQKSSTQQNQQENSIQYDNLSTKKIAKYNFVSNEE